MADKTNLSVVEGFLEAYWSGKVDETIALADPNFLWLNMPMPKARLEGQDALRALMTSGNGGFPEPIEAGEHVSGMSMEKDAFLLHERVDRFKVRGAWIEIPCNALWEVRDGRVKLWKDYYDLGIYIRGMAAVGIEIDTSRWW